MPGSEDTAGFEPTVIEDSTFGLSQLDKQLVDEAVRQGLITSVQGQMVLDSVLANPTQDSSASATVALMVDRGLIANDKAEELLDSLSEEFIPGYRLGKELGRGAMGVVYEATQKKLGRKVALKVVNPSLSSNADYVRRFKREAQTLAKLNHPHIVQVYDFGDASGRIFLALEFVEGEDVSAFLQREGAVPEFKALQIVRDVALGLSHAHHHGVIHRDVKPANLLLQAEVKDAEGKDFITKVTDFGLAREQQNQGGGELTQAGTILGTPAYMAPEQTEGKPACHRCDIYALGATLYHMLTGEVPYQDSSVVNILLKKRTERLQNPQLSIPDLSSQTIRLLDRMLARTPEERYQDYAALLTDIDFVLLGQEPLSEPLPEEHSSLQLHALVETAVRDRPPPGSARLGTVASLLSQLPSQEPQQRAFPIWIPAGLALLGLGGLAAFFATRTPPAPPPSPSGTPLVQVTSPTPPRLSEHDRLNAKIDALERLSSAELQAQASTLAELGTAIAKLSEFDRDVPSIRLNGLIDKALGSDTAQALAPLDAAWQAADYPRLAMLVKERQLLLDLRERAPSPAFARLSARSKAAAEEGPAERALWAKIQTAWSASPRDVSGLLQLLGDMSKFAAFSPELPATNKLRIELEASAPLVELIPVPESATLKVDGELQPAGPFRQRLVAGEHTFEASAEGYRDLSTTRTIQQRIAEQLFLSPLRRRELKIDPNFTTGSVRRKAILNPRRKGFWESVWTRDTGEWAILSTSPAGLDGTGSPLAPTIATHKELQSRCLAGLTPEQGALGWSIKWWMRPFQGTLPDDPTQEVAPSEAQLREAAAEVRLLTTPEGQVCVGYQDGQVYVGLRKPDGLYYRHVERYEGHPPQWYRVDFDHDVAEVFVKDGPKSPWRFFYGLRLAGADENTLSLVVLRGRILFSDLAVPDALIPAK